MKKIIFLFLVSFALTECKEPPDPQLQGGSTAIDQTWLNTQIATINASPYRTSFFIQQGEYQGSCVVFVNNCCAACNTTIVVYSCDGTQLNNVDVSKIIKLSIAWQPNDLVCKF